MTQGNRTSGNIDANNLNNKSNDMFNRNELNNAHLNREISVDKTGENMINGDNLMDSTTKSVE